MGGMERVNRIWNHPAYQEALGKLTAYEAEREFCRHTPEHFLSVARLTYLLALEQGVEADKEIIYAAGLLHDMGRYLQYENGMPHDEAGVRLAGPILQDCGFSEGESAEVLKLIGGHRTKSDAGDLPGLFYRADKLSRNCFLCPAQADCNWPEEKMNLTIRY